MNAISRSAGRAFFTAATELEGISRMLTAWRRGIPRITPAYFWVCASATLRPAFGFALYLAGLRARVAG